MFFEKDSTLEISNKRANYEKLQGFLITSQIEKIEQISKNSFIILTVKWKKKVKDAVHPDDIGVILNNGNILAFIHPDRVAMFKKEAADISVEKPSGAIMSTDIMDLEENEIKALISL